ncbi:MAG: ribosomal protection-like ABC-F family protein [Bryobacteraceae bacterium]|jgi:ATP-binding cassette, subfamily F, member 3
MSLLSLSQVSFAYSCGAPVLQRVSFSINRGDRVAFVGPNGAGKSTLLQLSAGRLEPSQGEITRRRNLTVAAAAQQNLLDRSQTLFDFAFGVFPPLDELRARIVELERDLANPAEYAERVNEYMERGGYQAEAEIERTLAGLGFATQDFSREISSLSGGERMRAHLARALATPADLLILDEPTNHLDSAARAWLEDALRSRDGACVIASHDRSLLAAFAERIVEIDRGRVRVFEGGYADYRRARAILDAQAWAAYEAFERRRSAMALAAERREALAGRVARAPDGIRGGKDHYARKAAKVARTARILRSRVDPEHGVEKPWEEQPIEGLSFARVSRGSDLVLMAEHLSKSYGARTLFRDVSFHLRRGGRLVIGGANGSGKTTLLNIIRGVEPTDAGCIRFGAHIEQALVAQDPDDMDPGLSPLQAVGTDTAARTLLACLRLRPECLNRGLDQLSGGERTKVALARVLHGTANLLLLDEPTNHLEIEAQEALEEALRLYPGAVVAVSHDRFFIAALGSEVTFVNL